jgi:hypothetical protein
LLWLVLLLDALGPPLLCALAACSRDRLLLLGAGCWGACTCASLPGGDGVSGCSSSDGSGAPEVDAEGREPEAVRKAYAGAWDEVASEERSDKQTTEIAVGEHGVVRGDAIEEEEEDECNGGECAGECTEACDEPGGCRANRRESESARGEVETPSSPTV